MYRKAFRCVAVLAAVAAAAAGAADCNLLLPSPPATCTAVGDAGWYDADCLDCVQASCCEQAALCAADPGCSVRESCLSASVPLLACPLVGGVDASAESQSSVVTSVVTGTAGALESCVATSCMAQCGGGPWGGEPWACLDGLSSPPPPSTVGDAGVTITIHPTLFSGSLCSPDTQLTITQVSRCANSYDMPCEQTFLNDAGTPGPFSIQVSLPFADYLDVLAMPTGGDAGPDDAPLESLVYLTWPTLVDTAIDLRFLTVNKLSTLAQIAPGIGAGQSFDADAGTLVVFAKDCRGNPAAGVTLAFTNPLGAGLHSDGFSIQGCLPIQQNSSNDAAPVVMTNALYGVAGWAEVTPGVAAPFTASVNRVQIAEVSPTLKPRSVLYVWLTPTPASEQQ